MFSKSRFLVFLFYFILVQISCKIANSPNIFQIAFQSLISQICCLVLFFRFSPQEATQAAPCPRVTSSLVQMHMWQPIKGHHCTVSESDTQSVPTHKQNNLSLSWQLGSKQIHQEHYTKTLTVFSEAISNKSMEFSFISSQRCDWTFITEPNPLQFKRQVRHHW